MTSSKNNDLPKGFREHHRVQVALYRRCRRGLPDALRALLYRNGDRWYTAALMASPDEDTAAGVTKDAWAALLTNLCRWRFGGGVERRGWTLLRRVLSQEVGTRGAARANSGAGRLDPDAAVAMPEALQKQLLQLADERAPEIRDAYYHRHRAVRTARIGLGVVAAAALSVAVWLLLIAGQASNSEVVWKCVRERVIAADMPGIIADAQSEFAIFEDEGRGGQRTLRQAGLILEEIANAPQASSPLVMGYLADRSRAERLAEGVSDVGRRYTGAFGKDLLRVGLILEEVETW